MLAPVSYRLFHDGKYRVITIIPVNETLPNGMLHSTGVYKLSEGPVGLGEIVFDSKMENWEYNGFGDISYQQVNEIMLYIKRINEEQDEL
ncbi:hypothetical protein GCM10023149_39940 [Mucilaginibacter gynuensis]|uniref:Uncharacterized protein n=1 Tax=Mucilaginibacter gynuensis TaxID=1302236 RepID=A0ABP8H211_9SPHI